MKCSISRKTLALTMILLFLGTILAPAISGDNGKDPALENRASSNTAGEPSRSTGFTSFTYGPLGNRISSTDANSATTYYLYEGTNVIQDRQQDGTLAREYISGISGKLAMIDHTDNGNKLAGEDEILYYLHDILGSVVVLTNANGNDCEQYYYEPYGETVITDLTGTIERDKSLFGNPYMWTGQRYDPENEFYHFPARSYSPSLGRWLQRDPLGYVDGLNLYEALRSNPLRYVDPLGLESEVSDLFWMSQQAHKHSEEAGKAFDEGVTKFSIGVTIAMGAGAICARLGLITSSILVGECTVDEAISYYHGPDAAIIADAAMDGPGLYTAKEMAEQGFRRIWNSLNIDSYGRRYSKSFCKHTGISLGDIQKASNNPKLTVRGRYTRKQLIKKCNELGCDEMIDDLPPVVEITGQLRSITELSTDQYFGAMRRLGKFFGGNIPSRHWNVPLPPGSKGIRQVMADRSACSGREVGLIRDIYTKERSLGIGSAHSIISGTKGEKVIAHTHTDLGFLWPSKADVLSAMGDSQRSIPIIGIDGTMVRFNLKY